MRPISPALGGLPLGECGQERKPLQREGPVCFYSFAPIYLHLLSLSLHLVPPGPAPLFFWSSSSRGPESVARWYARGIVQLFLAGTLTVRCIPGPPLEAQVRDVTPAEMATRQAQPTTFSRGQNTRFPKGCVFHPSPYLLLREGALGPEFPPRNCSRMRGLTPINLEWLFLKLKRSVLQIMFVIFFLSTTSSGLRHGGCACRRNAKRWKFI